MPSADHKIDWYTVRFEIHEAIDGVASALKFVRSDEFDDDSDMALSVWLYHVLDHLCFAWNGRAMGGDELLKQTQEEFDEMTFNIPNWTGAFRIMELTELKAQTSRLDNLLNGNAICHYLILAERELRELLLDIDRVRVDAGSLARLEEGLALVLQRICLAWHVRRMSVAGVEQTESDAECVFATAIPAWDSRYRLRTIER